jgi:hypothetical protein
MSNHASRRPPSQLLKIPLLLLCGEGLRSLMVFSPRPRYAKHQ